MLSLFLSQLSVFAPLFVEMTVGRGLAAIGAGLAVLTGLGSGLGEGSIGAHAMDAIGRNPEAVGVIRSNMILSIALAETTGIYGFAIAFLIIFAMK